MLNYYVLLVKTAPVPSN